MRYDEVDLHELLHPAQAFEHPRQVVDDPDLTLNEKRSILASWASGACAVEAAPAVRRAPGGRRPVQFDEIIDALLALDKQAQETEDRTARLRRKLQRGRFGPTGNPLHGG